MLAASLLFAAPAAFAQQAPTPHGDPESWLVAADYPSRPGSIAVKIDTFRMNTACTVIESSGSAELDREICKKLQRRARFNPATDAAGNPVPGSWTHRYSWPKPN